MKKKIRKRTLLKYIVGTLFLILAFVAQIATSWAIEKFATLDINTMLFHLRVPLAGTNTTSFTDIIIKCAIWAPLLSLPGLIAAIICSANKHVSIKIHKFQINVPINLWQRFYAPLSLLILICSLVQNANTLGLDSYLKAQFSPSELFAENYVDPKEANITFPEQKRNLIYIFMESMENTYSSPEYGGDEFSNLIPEMVDLQLNNTNFTSDNTRLNGAQVTTAASWTVAGMVAQTSGVPLLIPIDGNQMGNYENFLPGAYSVGDILETEGYHNVFLLGSEVEFGGRKEYMTQHGNYELLDYNYAIEQNWIPADYRVFWGYEDQKLYEFAKIELEILSQSDEPFNLTMLTVDTHFFDGYYCELCEDEYEDNQYANVIACSSRQLCDFINWIQEQDFYENTTIVICGDHLTMDNDYVINTTVDPDNYIRTTYTTIINPAIEYTLDYDRSFNTFDLLPTTISALGAKIEGERLGLGTNLFSTTPTLTEEYGFDYIDEELRKVSPYYNNHILFEQ